VVERVEEAVRQDVIAHELPKLLDETLVQKWSWGCRGGRRVGIEGIVLLLRAGDQVLLVSFSAPTFGVELRLPGGSVRFRASLPSGGGLG
jgi:hypothetical protein